MSVEMRVVFDPTGKLTEKTMANWNANFNANILKRFNEVIAKAEQIIIEKTPIRTGYLRNSVYVEPDLSKAPEEFSAEIGASAPYADYQERGFTSRGGRWIEGKHFLRDSIPEIQGMFNEIMTSMTEVTLSKAWRKGGFWYRFKRVGKKVVGLVKRAWGIHARR